MQRPVRDRRSIGAGSKRQEQCVGVMLHSNRAEGTAITGPARGGRQCHAPAPPAAGRPSGSHACAGSARSQPAQGGGGGARLLGGCLREAQSRRARASLEQRAVQPLPGMHEQAWTQALARQQCAGRRGGGCGRRRAHLRHGLAVHQLEVRARLEALQQRLPGPADALAHCACGVRQRGAEWGGGSDTAMQWPRPTTPAGFVGHPAEDGELLLQRSPAQFGIPPFMRAASEFIFM